MDLDELDAAGLLDAATDVVRRRRLLEVEDLQVVAQWAATHSSDPTDGPDGRRRRRSGDVLVPVGGEGTPGVQDFCLGELAVARGTGVTATVNVMADVLDLHHRLPATWLQCRSGDAEVWVARRVAKLSRHLPAAVIASVDTAVAAVIASEAAGRVLEVADGAIVAADPWLYDGRVEAEKRRRYVGFGRVDEHGLRTIVARVTAGDAVWVEATVARVAEILAPQHGASTPDEIRSLAFGYLARPAELLALLLDHTDAEGQPHEQPEDRPHRAIAFPADLLEALRAADLSPLAPRARLFVHLHEAALTSRTGVARVEGVGPTTMAGLTELLARTHLTVQPVLDLAGRVRSTAYEHPERLAEQVFLTTGGDYWPFATSTSRRVDYDHVTAYDEHGPPGQTGSHNCGPLGRRHHRWKTHAGWRARQSGAGRYVWLTPHGLGFLVDHRGTRRISREHAEMVIGAPPGVDLYPADG